MALLLLPTIKSLTFSLQILSNHITRLHPLGKGGPEGVQHIYLNDISEKESFVTVRKDPKRVEGVRNYS